MRGKGAGKRKPIEEPKKKSSYVPVTGERKTQDDQRRKITDYLMKLLGYEKGNQIPRVAYQRLEEFRYTCGFQAFYDVMREQSDVITKAISKKEFKNDSGKILYVFAIIKNSLGSRDTTYEDSNKKTSEFDGIPKDYDAERTVTRRKARDISMFLDDEE